MDTSIIVAIITGIFGAVITPIMKKVINQKRKGHGLDKPEDDQRKIIPKIIESVIGGFIGILLGYLFMRLIITSPCSLFAPTNIIITSPLSSSDVPRLVMIQGTACHIPEGSEILILVVPNGSTAYYPQPGPVIVSNDGYWSTSAYLGLDDPVDAGREFAIIAALADNKGLTSINHYFSQSGPEYKGIEQLPPEIQLITQVRVIRK